jgi:PncC family amidohydrolase
MPFLTEEQKSLANEIASLLTTRGESVAVADGTTGGLIAAALLWVPGASKYFSGGAVLYTLNSRVQLAGAPTELFENYRGTTAEMITAVAESLRTRLGATWCIAESGLAGPTGGRTGAPPGRSTVGVVGPVSRTHVLETGSADREENMIAFTTNALRFLRDAIAEAP